MLRAIPRNVCMPRGLRISALCSPFRPCTSKAGSGKAPPPPPPPPPKSGGLFWKVLGLSLVGSGSIVAYAWDTKEFREKFEGTRPSLEQVEPGMASSKQSATTLPLTTDADDAKNPPSQEQKPVLPVTIVVSSRALFELEEEHAIWEKDGPVKYLETQKERESVMLKPGTAYPFIKVLDFVNTKLKEIGSKEKFEVAMMSHNHASTGIRLIDSIRHNNLNIKRMALTDGESPVKYLKPFNVDLFLTFYEDEVVDALSKGIAAAKMHQQKVENPVEDELRIAFDLDAVLFCDESEKKFQELLKEDPGTAVEKYEAHEWLLSDTPLKEGPLKQFAEAIGKIQKEFMNRGVKCPIKTYIVTARGVVAGKRALHTLEGWDLIINETFLMSGLSKDGVLREIRPHIFFDDTKKHIDKAKAVGVPAAHVKAK